MLGSGFVVGSPEWPPSGHTRVLGDEDVLLRISRQAPLRGLQAGVRANGQQHGQQASAAAVGFLDNTTGSIVLAESMTCAEWALIGREIGEASRTRWCLLQPP